MKKRLAMAAGVILPAVSAYAGVVVTSPTSGSSAASPVHVVASATMSHPVIAMQVYVDGKLSDQKSAATLNDEVAVAAGSHTLVVQAWDNSGNYSKSSAISLSVSSSGGGGSTGGPSTGATTYSNIDQMSGWESCGACAGEGGNGPVVPYSLVQNVGSPSMDGRSAKFTIGGSKPYGDALWWKQLGANAKVSHFIYDTYFYYTDASAPQALEFDGNQSVGGHKYIFGNQCDVAVKQWDVWDTAGGRWIHTGIACTAPPTYQWNHLVIEFERSGAQTHFVAVTLNGKKSYINRTFNTRSVSANELNLAFQMDLNSKAKGYSVWLDKMQLTAW